MTNTALFKRTFNKYATEVWAMPESEFLKWLNDQTNVPDINVGDMVSRSYLLSEYDRQHKGEAGRARNIIEEAPSAEPEIIR